MKNKLSIFIFLVFITSDLASQHPAGEIFCNEDEWVKEVEHSKFKCIASSILNSTGKITYAPSNLVDKDSNTCWCPEKGSSINQFIIMKIPYGIKGIKIVNGVAANKKLFYENNRVKRIYLGWITNKLSWDKEDIEHDICQFQGKQNRKYVLAFDTGEKSYIELDDSMQYQTILFSNIKSFSWKKPAFLKSKDTIYLIISIVDIYKGTKYNDTCISEIEIIK